MARHAPSRPLSLERRASATGMLLFAAFASEADAGAAVSGLRSSGWSAVLRPASGGHLAAWQANTAPVYGGDRLCVCFPWSEFERPEVGCVVEIDPGAAFGSGRHPTTRLLLGELAQALRPGDSVLDVGCGSGVLGVSAACLGASNVVAIDLAPEAVDATRANAARNGVADLVAASATPVESLEAAFDVVLANIDFATLCRLAPVLRSRVRPAGWLGLSGVSPAQVSRLSASYDWAAITRVSRDDDWVAVVAEIARSDQARAASRVSTDGAK